ncbi:MAG: hypothetical protein ACK5JR_02300 [Tropicimonas sp.]|uniref:hypothetical protein n=1 Tax=Tropicimonas sp. TaxID=2067044 RepID=UPI003A8916D1
MIEPALVGRPLAGPLKAEPAREENKRLTMTDMREIYMLRKIRLNFNHIAHFPVKY